jgi:ectoine hydroxylase-related dioxygenase (phytanoyl-CoA dioxygenase family)
MTATSEFFSGLAMKELAAVNGLLDDPEALEKFWSDNGYLFLKDVLDHAVLSEVRAVIVEALTARGVGVEEDEDFIWSGKPFDDLPRYPEDIYARQPARNFVSAPSVNAVLMKVLREQPFWIPISTYRFTPPSEDPAAKLFVHQDGYFNQGIPFRICWIPLVEIDERIGGIAVAPGYHKRGFLHDSTQPPRFPIPDDAIDPADWHRAEWDIGDLLVMDRRTPHVGLSNTSDRVRLSMDVRVIRASDPERPLVGTIAAIDPNSVTICEPSGETTLVVDSETYLRKRRGDRIPLEDLASSYQVGEEAMVAHAGGRALVIRPVVY